MNLPDLLCETARLGMMFSVGSEGKLHWRSREEPPPDLLRSLAVFKKELLSRLTEPAERTEHTAAPVSKTAIEEHAFVAALKAEIDAIERRDFGGQFPPVLKRVIGHYLAGPVTPEADLAGWWRGARREVLQVIARAVRSPSLCQCDCTESGRPFRQRTITPSGCSGQQLSVT